MFVPFGFTMIFSSDINSKGNLSLFMGNTANTILFKSYSSVVLCPYFLYTFNIVILSKFEDINNKI